MFDKELWPIVADDGPEVKLGVVSNVVKVSTDRAVSYEVVIRIPSSFFQYMQRILKVTREEALANPVSFYMEEYRDKWYFGVSYFSEYARAHDLWVYSKLPAWANRARCL